jgi:hypothetical protein
MITPSYRALSLVVALLASTTTVNGQDLAADTEKTSAKELKLHQSLLGAWVLAGSPGRPNEPAADAEMKLWGLGHFVVTKRNAETGEIDYHHLGTYKLDGDQYSETITYAIGATEDLVGQTFNFKIAVNGDTYIQRGLGNPWNQQWKRLGSTENSNDDDARAEIE